MRSLISTVFHSYIVRHKIILALFFLALLNTTLLIIPNYQYTCADNACGLSMVDTYFHDAFWHTAIAAASFSTFPFQMPIFSGDVLHGYHFVYDLILFLLGRFGFSYLFLYWRLSPYFYTILITVIAIAAGRKIINSPIFVGLLLFFIYFGGTASFIANFIIKGSAFGYGVSSLFHASTTVLYPTVAFSYCLILGMFIILKRKNIGFSEHLLAGCLLLICMGLKFYAGITMLIILSVFECITTFQKIISRNKLRPSVIHLLMNSVVVLLTYGVFFVVSLVMFYEFPHALVGTEPVFSFAPFATVHPVIEDQYIYPLNNLVLARQTLFAAGMSPRLIVLEAFTTVLFLFHHFGTRIIGVIYLFWLIKTKKIKALDIACLTAIIITTLLSMFLVQRGEQWWNSMQFMYYSTFLAGIYTAAGLYHIVKTKNKWAILFVILILFLTIPNTIEKISEVYKTKKRAVSYAELSALSYLKKQPAGFVFSVPLMPDTAYISALSGKQTYYSDEEMLRNTGVLYEKRKEKLLHPQELDLNSVKAPYAYLVKSDENYRLFLRKAKESSYHVLYENKEVTVLLRN